jgi:hypothetical protein
MNPRLLPTLGLSFTFLIATVACAADTERASRGGRRSRETGPTELSRTIAADVGSADAPLLFCVGLHIEPFGAGKSGQMPDDRAKRENAGNRKERIQDYNDPAFFERHLTDIQTLVGIVEKHGGKMTIQSQTPFTRVLAESKPTFFADLAQKGHEIALHFHEDAHLGRKSEGLPVKSWTDAMISEIDWLKKAGAPRIRYWSGGNLYGHLLEAANAAKLDVMGDYKNPKKQETDLALLAVNPWRPVGEPTDLTAFARHDSKGKIVYLPDGIFAGTNFKERKQSGDAAFLDCITDGLERSLNAARGDRVNVFHLTVHPSELRGSPRDSQPFSILDQWLTQVIDPLVKDGRVRWATYSEMADSFARWEKSSPGINPRSEDAPPPSTPTPSHAPAASSPSSPAKTPRGYITFAINVHDTVHVGESADTLLRLIDIFKKNKVHGDFYLTAPIAERYAQNRSDVITSLRDGGMTVSYHIRPPHPVYLGFDARLKNLKEPQLSQTLKDYETYGLDLATGDLDRSRAGGYTYVKQVFGRPPVCVSSQSHSSEIRAAMNRIHRAMGARMTVAYHETGTDLNEPFKYSEGLLIRPSDFSITRDEEDSKNFWWNRIADPDGEAYDPATMLKAQLEAWKGSRPPFVTALIHENNFCRRGPEAWKAFYFTDPRNRTPASSPYNLEAADPSKLRSHSEQEKIWKAYEALVAYAAANLQVVTSEDLASMAEARAKP